MEGLHQKASNLEEQPLLQPVSSFPFNGNAGDGFARELFGNQGGYEVENGEYPGYSLLRPPPKDRTLYFSCITNRKCLASLKGNEKYIHHYTNQPDELFDLPEVPTEEHNLASERSKEELDERRQRLFERRTKVNDQYGKTYQ